MDEDKIAYLKNRLFRYLKLRPRTEREIFLYLEKIVKQKNFPLGIIEKLMSELKRIGLIDDKKFIELYVSDRVNLKPKGKKVLIYELKKKGIDERLIEEYFAKNELNEEELAKKSILPRWERLKKLEKNKREEKVLRFLLSRGFSYETARKVIKKMNNE